MKDARHKRPYPEGDRKEMTPEWKQLVLDKLAENKLAGITPGNKSELAKKIGADKSNFTAFFREETTSSKLVVPICAALGIEPPLQLPQRRDALELLVAKLSDEQRGPLLAIVENLLLLKK